MRIAVTGAGGQLGRELLRAIPDAGHEAVGWTRAELDVTDGAAVEGALEAAAPDAVVHAAAYTAVDRAEREPAAAHAVNDRGTAHVAAACARLGVPVVVYPSTDYVFDGGKRRPYEPHDVPRPLNVYGASKLAGERRVAESGAEHLIVRTSWLYGAGGRSFVRTVLRRALAGEPLRIVADQVGSPTWTGSLAPALVPLLEANARGLVHVTDLTSKADGAAGVTWCELARGALEEAGIEAALEPVTSSEWPSPARRPAYSVLDVSLAERLLNRGLVPWRDALRRAVPELLATLPAPSRRAGV